MGKIAVVTDSNSGITQEKGKELGVHVIPMPFYIDGELFLEDITLTQEAFYEKLASDCEISTSQTFLLRSLRREMCWIYGRKHWKNMMR